MPYEINVYNTLTDSIKYKDISGRFSLTKLYFLINIYVHVCILI